MPFLEHPGNNNDDFVPTLSRSFHHGLVDKARQMNYDDDDLGKNYKGEILSLSDYMF